VNKIERKLGIFDTDTGPRTSDHDSLSRRNFIKASAFSLAGILSGCAFAKKNQKSKNIPLPPFKGRLNPKFPNVLLILADDQGAHTYKR